MKKYHGLTVSILALSLAGCYLPQNFNNQVQVSRTGQYQVDVDTDVVNGNLLASQNEAKARKTEIPANELKKISADCEKIFYQTVAQDAKDGKHILSSKYLGECRGHLTLKYTGNIINEKNFDASITLPERGFASSQGFFIPVAMKYNAKTKQISIKSATHGDKDSISLYGLIQYNGKLSVKTDGKVISTNADSKPYWGLIGSYKWGVKDLTTPNASMVIATSGI